MTLGDKRLMLNLKCAGRGIKSVLKFMSATVRVHAESLRVSMSHALSEIGWRSILHTTISVSARVTDNTVRLCSK